MAGSTLRARDVAPPGADSVWIDLEDGPRLGAPSHGEVRGEDRGQCGIRSFQA